jgi:hypothetical protein
VVAKVVEYGEPKRKVLVALPATQIDEIKELIEDTQLTFVGFVRSALDREVERLRKLAERRVGRAK